MYPTWLSRDRISLGKLCLLVALPGLFACSDHESAVNANIAGSPQSNAGTFGGAAPSAAAGLGGANSIGSAGAPNAAGALSEGGVTASAGGVGAATGSVPGMGFGGGAGAVAEGSSGTASASAGHGSAGFDGSAGSGGSSAAFTQVSALLGKNCGISGCHADKQTPHFVPGPMLYATLTGPNTVLAACDYTKLVEPGDPSKSALVRLMNRKCGTFTMPPSCNKTTCLSAADLDTLSAWIQLGAPP